MIFDDMRGGGIKNRTSKGKFFILFDTFFYEKFIYFPHFSGKKTLKRLGEKITFKRIIFRENIHPCYSLNARRV